MQIHLDIDKNEDNNSVLVTEISDNGTKKTKQISTYNFLQKYTSFIKEKEDNYESVYFPPGNIDYYKNVNSATYVVHSYNYKQYYDIEKEEIDFLVVAKLSLQKTRIIEASVYSTKGAFNKTLSRFTKIITIKNIHVEDEDDAIKKCIEAASNTAPTSFAKKIKYSDIL